MYFRDVPLNETTHRAVLFTNAWAVSREPIDLSIGRFMFATSSSPVTPLTIEVMERLEAVRPDGSDEVMVATGGTELIDDAADVFSFALNVTCSRNAALVERLVPQQLGGRPTRMSGSILRRTFDAGVILRDDDVAVVREFATKLLALRRDHFEAAIRSVRGVVDAALLVSDDPGLAFTIFVAALESLAQLSIPAEATRSWETYDSKRRKIFDAAVADAALDPEQAARMRGVVLEIDQLSLRRRFMDFTIAHVEPSYYRSDAMAAVRPIRANDMPHALDVAYGLRSRNVHLLEALAPELWAITDRADTLRWEGRSVLSLEGMNRLCRHVIRTFVDRAPTELDTSFDYRERLPGIVKVQLAPQYWIWKPDGFTVERSPGVLEGFVELLLDPEAEVVDLSGVLDKIEATLPSTARLEDRQPMVAIYVLWHAFLSREHHRPNAEEIIERYDQDLDSPSVIGFAVRLLTSNEVEWSHQQLTALVARRRDELRRGRGQPLPARIDAALLLATAIGGWEAGRVADAVVLISEAVDALPGCEELIALEGAAARGNKPRIDLRDFVVGQEPAMAAAGDGTSTPGSAPTTATGDT
jgi:hypothetical protein